MFLVGAGGTRSCRQLITSHLRFITAVQVHNRQHPSLLIRFLSYQTPPLLSPSTLLHLYSGFQSYIGTPLLSFLVKVIYVIVYDFIPKVCLQLHHAGIEIYFLYHPSHSHENSQVECIIRYMCVYHYITEHTLSPTCLPPKH